MLNSNTNSEEDKTSYELSEEDEEPEKKLEESS